MSAFWPLTQPLRRCAMSQAATSLPSSACHSSALPTNRTKSSEAESHREEVARAPEAGQRYRRCDDRHTKRVVLRECEYGHSQGTGLMATVAIGGEPCRSAKI